MFFDKTYSFIGLLTSLRNPYEPTNVCTNELWLQFYRLLRFYTRIVSLRPNMLIPKQFIREKFFLDTDVSKSTRLQKMKCGSPSRFNCVTLHQTLNSPFCFRLGSLNGLLGLLLWLARIALISRDSVRVGGGGGGGSLDPFFLGGSGLVIDLRGGSGLVTDFRMSSIRVDLISEDENVELLTSM